MRLQTPFDRGRIAALFAGVSAEARFLRFGTGMPPTLPRRFLDRLANVDGEHHVGLVALHDGVVVAATRYLRRSDLPSEAEVAITVTDAFQRRGLGRLLVETLRDDAAARGIERFTSRCSAPTAPPARCWPPSAPAARCFPRAVSTPAE